MGNGEKQDFLEKIKLFIKLVFSQEIMMEVAREMQEEYDQSRRDAALKEERKQNESDEALNHC